MMGKKNFFISILLVALIFFFFRGLNIENRLRFAWDEERDAFQVREIILERDLTLIGPRVVSAEGFFLGPYYYYLLVPFYLISELHPWSLILFVLFNSLLFFFISLLVVSRIWGRKHAFYFLLLWAINPMLIASDTTAWNVLLIPTGIMCLLGFTHLVKNQQSKGWLVIVGLILGILVNFHVQAIFVALFVFTAIYQVGREKNNWAQHLLLSGLGFLLSFSPLIIFDLRHDFLNTRLLLSFFSSESSGFLISLTWLNALSNAFGSLLIVKKPWMGATLLAILVLLCWKLYNHCAEEKKKFYSSLIFVLLFTALSFSLHSQSTSEYYFLFMFPFVIITLVDFFICKQKEWLLTILIAISFVFSFNEIVSLLQTQHDSLSSKDMVVSEIVYRHSQEKRLAVSLNTDLGKDAGYYYLFEYYQLNYEPKEGDWLVELVIPDDRDIVNYSINGVGIKTP